MWGADVETPVGRLRVVCDDASLLGVYFPGHVPPPRYAAPDGTHPLLEEAADQLQQWCRGDRRSFDLPVVVSGTDLQVSVWHALREIPYGESTSYGALAQRLGRPGSARAVGAAVGRNPLSIVIPCHRVVGSDGRLAGFAGGVERKRWLLDHESGVGSLFGPR